MRDFLTGLAIVLIVVLTTLLVAPYFVDWTGQRGFLEARLSTALGQKVTIGGNIDLKLLPTPYLVLDQVVVGGDDGPVRVGVRHLNLELAVAPLLHGEFDFVEARLREPTIRVALERDRSLPALPPAPAGSADVRFDRIKVSDGTLAVADPQSGRTFVLDHIDLDADAGSFAGPFKIAGAEGTRDRRSSFRLTTTAMVKSRLHAKLLVDETSEHPALDLDGTVDLHDASGGRIRQSFDGTLAAAGRVRAAGDPVAWRLAGPFKLDPDQATLEAGELRLGDDQAGLTLQAGGHLELAATPKLAVSLEGKQLDIDRLAGAPTEAGTPPPPKLPDSATLRRVLGELVPPIDTAVDLSVDTATYGGETLSGIELHLGLGGTAKHPLRLALDGPGGGHIAVDGTLDGSTGDAFTGTFDLGADNLPRTLSWLALVAPSVPWSGRDLAVKSIKLAGHVATGETGIEATGLSLALDRSKLTGTGRLAFGDAARPAKLSANLTAATLDLDGLPSFATLRSSSQGLDLDLRLDAKAVNVSNIGDGALATGRLRLAVTKTGPRFEIGTLRIDDLGGASIQANGHVDRNAGRFAVTLEAKRLDAVAGVVRRLVPGAAADAFVARADALAPAKLDLDLALAGGTAGALAPASGSITGTAGKTKIYAEVKPETGATSLSASLEAADGSTLLRQLGVPTVPIETVGPGRVTLAARRQGNEPFDTTLSAAFGPTTVDVTGRFVPSSDRMEGSGRLSLHSTDLSPLLQALAIAFPDLSGRLSADVTTPISIGEGAVGLGDLRGKIAGVGVRGALRWQRPAGDAAALTGTLDSDRLALSSLLALELGQTQPAESGTPWSNQPFAPGLIDPPRIALRLGARTLDILPGIEGRNAAFDLTLGPGVVSLDKLAVEVLDGHAEGGGALRRDGRQATLEARIALKDVAVRIPSTLDTSLSLHLDLAGAGTSAHSLVASLAGAGEATTTAVSVPKADPAAVVKAFDQVENDTITADPDATQRAFDEAAGQRLVTMPMRFAVTVASGVIHLDPKDRPVKGQAGVASKIGASVDLARFRFAAHVDETLEALPRNWSGPPPTVVIGLDGPIGRPERSIDMSGFSDALTSRAVAREAARIEASALDVRERAVFSARLKFEERRREERQKAEDDAREAEAERKARLEAAREERARREQAKDNKDGAGTDKPPRSDPPTNRPGDMPNAGQPQQPPPPDASHASPGNDPSAYGRY